MKMFSMSKRYHCKFEKKNVFTGDIVNLQNYTSRQLYFLRKHNTWNMKTQTNNNSALMSRFNATETWKSVFLIFTSGN